MNAVADEGRRQRGFRTNVSRLRIESVQADDSGALADRDEIARVFDRLSVEQRTIVVLHHYLGMTLDEAATAIGIPRGTAKSRLHYATSALRAAIEADARSASAGRILA
jgi:RNA polymerase sigma-70 factor (ECF subfamily)